MLEAKMAHCKACILIPDSEVRLLFPLAMACEAETPALVEHALAKAMQPEEHIRT